MKTKDSESLIGVLDEIDVRIKNIENSPNRLFVLIEYETISMFHNFNLCFKKFWNQFDRNSASHLFKYMESSKRFLEICERYEKLLKEQIDYLRSKIDFCGKCIDDTFPAEIFSEERKKDYIEYYQEYLGGMCDGKFRPIYKIESTTRDAFETKYVRLSQNTNYYELRYDEYYDLHNKAIVSTYYCIKNLVYLISFVRT